MRIALFVPVFFLACSGSDDAAPAQSDAGSDGAKDSAEVVGPKCGNAPYVRWTGKVTFNDGAGEKPAAGAKMTSPACAETLTIGADGTYTLNVQKGLTSVSKIEKDGALKMLVGEWSADADREAVNLLLLPNLFAGFIPDWDPSAKPAVIMRVGPAAEATGACADRSGVIISVKDQPDAKVSYFSEAAIPTAVMGATSTTKSGIATITNVTGTHIEIIGTKTGCVVELKTWGQTGRTAIDATYLTNVAILLKN
jgi:hypothetical protein